MAERAKARVLLEVLRSTRTNPQGVVAGPERERLAVSGQEVAALNRQIAAASGNNAASLLAETLRQVRRERDAAESDTLVAHPELRNRRTLTSVPLSAANLVPLLGQQSALLEHIVTNRETFLFVVRRGTKGSGAEPDVQVFRLPITSRQ